MKRLCFFSLFFNCLFALSIGFNYQFNVPKEAFYTYDWLVINSNVKRYKTDSKLIAYFSVEENEKKLNPKWIIGYNQKWHSYIYDIRNKEYKKYLLNKIKKLNNFDGVFLDTLDSFELTKVDKKSYKNALLNFLKEVKKIFKNKIIIFNRGFEFIDEVKPNAIVVENLFTNDNGRNISKNEKKFIISELNNAKTKGIIPIVIDYIEPFDKHIAVDLAKKIQNLGFIPYIADKNLYSIGVSNTYLIPRKILVVYNTIDSKENSLAHIMVSMPLEFFGYIPDLKTVTELPYDTSMYDYIIVVLEKKVKNQKIYQKWLNAQIKQGKKILFLSEFGLENLSFLKINTYKSNSYCFSLYKSALKPFESTFDMGTIKTYPIIDPLNAKYLVTFVNKANQKTVIAAKTEWGGYFINPFDYYGNIILWKVNPFTFIPETLGLKELPLPDFTTENGRRIWFSHIDGDGFVNKNIITSKFASEELYEKVFSKYNLPFSVSVIEGEIAPYGLYPQYSEQAMKIARKIFRLKNVEPASHSFSHPFDWVDKNHPRLPIKNYRFSFIREINGSLKFVSKLAGKKSNLFFWTGACNPPRNVLAYVDNHGILAINGQDTYIMKSKKFLYYIAPLGIYRGEYFQIYAQMANENIYTDLWKNKLGYIKAKQTIELTENPRRLKAVDIYFHHYSGAYPASLYALKNVINYSLKQHVLPMYTSEWIKIAKDFENSYLLKDLNGFYIYKNSSDLRTLKIKGNHDVDVKKSKGVLGYVFEKGYTYISLDNTKLHKIVFGKSDVPYLKYANKRIMSHRNGIYNFDEGFGDLKVDFFLPKNCKLIIYNNAVKVKCAAEK
ncbi:hypothetical protein NAMH_1428 [Nautilia profundicola AmH]|uniref:Uncharacterized protein n=1 Tax=Nautilia profundicola (strain ATCC BAA-1463 / DSM 18972 / AmH) TaxID=598659 RepID=B9L632_NAUPA|nr:endo alpha-1,4 polygalactosaminidase [Nautilia profundicola]ACM93363.1 hypothetical protein NAMH_1428 [Nautilia profundicola AmH]